MSYRLNTEEALANGIRRIAREQLQGALCEISRASAGREDVAVHATRKHVKKVRALLRLVREKIGKQIYKVENRTLREVGRTFADSRDARVRLEVLEKLVEQSGEIGAVFPNAAAALKQAANADDNFGPRQEEAVATLQRICDHIDGWPLENLEIPNLCSALREAYRRGRKCLRGVNTERTPEEFHSLRKRVKDIWYQSRLLRNLNEPVLCDLEESANTLGRQLGDLHDLATFRGWLEQEREVSEVEGDVLIGLLCAREQRLELVALDLGARFFAEKPKVFERRLLRYARDWPPPPVLA